MKIVHWLIKGNGNISTNYYVQNKNTFMFFLMPTCAKPIFILIWECYLHYSFRHNILWQNQACDWLIFWRQLNVHLEIYKLVTIYFKFVRFSTERLSNKKLTTLCNQISHLRSDTKIKSRVFIVSTGNTVLRLAWEYYLMPLHLFDLVSFELNAVC